MKTKDLHKSYGSALLNALFLAITITLSSAFVADSSSYAPYCDIMESDTEGNSIVIYPNPLTEDYMFLEADVSGIIMMYNETGEKVFKSNYEAGKNKLDIKEISKNTYTVKIVSDNSMAFTTFELERR